MPVSLFERKEDTALFKLAFEQGEKFGRLSTELDHMRATVDRLLAAQPAGVGLAPLDPVIAAVLTEASRGIPELYRFLETQARELIAKDVPVTTVVEQIKRGAKRKAEQKA